MGKGRQIDIMGIVNLTDDSYFAESRCVDVPAALERVSRMLEEGADIIDIGACSTRPGSLPVGAEEEWRRLGPVLKAVREAFPCARLSIDTYWSSVVRKAYDLIGDFIVNDISAGEDDSGMLPTVGELGLTYIAMHKRGTSQTMQQMTDYQDVVAEVKAYFDEFSAKADSFGIRDWVLDPGIGFAKTIEQNYELIRRLDEMKTVFTSEGCSPRILVGVSRKSLIYKYLGISPAESLPATQVLHLAALQNGADILRVHDVAEAVHTRVIYGLLA
ncbi:MAG: dihydropteroate synthase [Bacteroidales bacterium]|nr:dihydropteroate synthase [Bacteroidales bacterium]MBR5861808.1 dihydropteroate synthase [Bacteroidales bacterium]